MKKIQKPIISRIGAQDSSSAAQGEAVGSLALTMTRFSMSRLARPSYWGGAKVRKNLVGLGGAGDLVARDGDRVDLPGIDPGDELAEADEALLPLEVGGEVPDQGHDGDQDDPEHEALQGRIQNCLRANLSPQGQDYHGLRVGGHPERLPDDVARDPGDAALRIDHDRHPRALVARHLAIDEHVLQLLTTAKAQRLHPISRLPPPDGEMPAQRHCVQHRPGLTSGASAGAGWTAWGRVWARSLPVPTTPRGWRTEPGTSSVDDVERCIGRFAAGGGRGPY